jgi:N-acetylmuramoyl-L-alanine amidase
MLGRPIGQLGAHVEGDNQRTVGWCKICGVSAGGKPAKDSLRDVVRLCGRD